MHQIVDQEHDSMHPPETPHVDIAAAILAMVEDNARYRETTHAEMSEAMESVSRTLDAVDETVRALHIAMKGDDLGNPGIVKRQGVLREEIGRERDSREAGDRRLHERLDAIEAQLLQVRNTAIGIGIGAGVGTAGALGGILKVFGHL